MKTTTAVRLKKKPINHENEQNFQGGKLQSCWKTTLISHSKEADLEYAQTSAAFLTTNELTFLSFEQLEKIMKGDCN